MDGSDEHLQPSFGTSRKSSSAGYKAHIVSGSNAFLCLPGVGLQRSAHTQRAPCQIRVDPFKDYPHCWPAQSFVRDLRAYMLDYS